MSSPESPAHDGLTHFDAAGHAHMVNVSEKAVTQRTATAQGFVTLEPQTLQKILARGFVKGDVFEISRLAGIMATKRTSDLIPLCHPLPIDAVTLSIEPVGPTRVKIEATVVTTARTGVEMEALTAVSCAALTVYDMCKSVDRGMSIGPIQLIEKSGGKSGHYRRSSGD